MLELATPSAAEPSTATPYRPLSWPIDRQAFYCRADRLLDPPVYVALKRISLRDIGFIGPHPLAPGVHILLEMASSQRQLPLIIEARTARATPTEAGYFIHCDWVKAIPLDDLLLFI